jgi:uncharacterized protein YoxC
MDSQQSNSLIQEPVAQIQVRIARLECLVCELLHKNEQLRMDLRAKDARIQRLTQSVGTADQDPLEDL